jgi:hypothetical protein
MEGFWRSIDKEAAGRRLRVKVSIGLEDSEETTLFLAKSIGGNRLQTNADANREQRI